MSEPSNHSEDTKVIDAEVIEVETPKPSWRQRIFSAEHWLRFAFMILFGLILSVTGYVMTVLVIVQFIWVLVAGEGNTKLRELGSSLSQYIYQMLRFVTYNSEEKPFPFSDWPESEKHK